MSADDTSCVEIAGLAKTGLFAPGASLTITTLCTVLGADPSPGACPEAGRVGGCADGDDGVTTTTWSYTGTIDDLTCSSDEQLIGPDGEPVIVLTDTGLPTTCSTDLGGAVTVTFSNSTAGPVSLYWVDRSCVEQPYGSLAAATTLDQGTFIGHAWRVREGESDPTGSIRWEGVVTEAGTIVIP